MKENKILNKTCEVIYAFFILLDKFEGKIGSKNKYIVFVEYVKCAIFWFLFEMLVISIIATLLCFKILKWM